MDPAAPQVTESLIPLCQQQLLYCILRNLCQKTGPRAHAAHRLCSPVTAAAPVIVGHWHVASRPQNSHCPQAWIPHTCRNSCGSWYSMPASRPKGSCYKKLGSPVPAVLLYRPPGAHAQQAGPRTPATHGLGSLTPAAAAVAPGSL
jgi:hypothetical protein